MQRAPLAGHFRLPNEPFASLALREERINLARKSDESVRRVTVCSDANTHLASYGTLAPGRVNHRELASLSGSWQSGTVKGWLVDEGWATQLGYPALVLDPNGLHVEVALFESEELPAHWSRLDEFEGSSYRRVITRVETVEGSYFSYIYVAAHAEQHDCRR